LAIALSLGATQAMAQPGYYYYGGGYGGGPIRPPYDVGPIQGLSTRQITRIVRSAGLRPVAQPRRIGRNYIVSSVDRHGVVKRVVIDAMAGEIVRVREARGPIARGDGVRTIGPDAEPSDDNGSPRTHARVPGTPPAAKADRQKKTVASAPAASEKPPHEADTESLPKAEGAVTIPPQAQPEQAGAPKSTASLPSEPAATATPEAPKADTAKPAETRSATVMPAKPPLPVRRPSAAAPQSAVAKPDTAAKEKEATPASSPRVVLPGGPPAAKDETTASTSAPKADDTPKAAPSSEQPAISIVPPQSYE
jgi:hypothetical protein